MRSLLPDDFEAKSNGARRRADTRTRCSRVAGAGRKRRVANGQKTFYPTELDDELAVVAAQVERDFRDPLVPEHQREQLRRLLGMRLFYEDWMLPERRRHVTTGERADETARKDRQVLNRWEKYSRPDGWPATKPWTGVPIGSITSRYIEWVLDRMAKDLAPATVRSTWNMLQSFLNYAEEVRALEKAPHPNLQKLARREAKIYTREQIEIAYHAFDDFIDLQVAFVLGINAGPRTEDLFGLRWDGLDLVSERPTLTYIARKTETQQKVPLAPVTVQQLRRLPSFGTHELLFPGRSNPEAKDPERSKPSLRRRELVRTLLGHAGLDVEKPFQRARATCNTNLNSTPGFNGAGKFFLGHELSLNSISYMHPSDFLFQAANAAWQPACFLSF